MNGMKLLLCTPDDGVMTTVMDSVLREEGFAPRIVVIPDKDDTVAINREIADADVVYPNKALVTAATIAAAQRLRLIHCGTGYDTVDLAAAAARGIAVCNTGPVMAQSTAEHTLFLLLSLAKNGGQVFGEMQSGQWQRRLGVELCGKVLGLVGYGNIARLVAGMARAIGITVIANRRSRTTGEADGVRFVTLGELLDAADIISIHSPLVPAGPDRTLGLLGAAELARFGQRGLGWIINTARGAIIDEAALIDALRGGIVRKAALDVYPQEPLAPGHPLRDLPQVLLTPHVAGDTLEALRARYSVIARNAARVLSGRAPEFQIIRD